MYPTNTSAIRPIMSPDSYRVAVVNVWDGDSQTYSSDRTLVPVVVDDLAEALTRRGQRVTVYRNSDSAMLQVRVTSAGDEPNQWKTIGYVLVDPQFGQTTGSYLVDDKGERQVSHRWFMKRMRGIRQ